MPFLKTLSGGSGGCRQVDDYLAFGHVGTEDHEQRMERYLAGDRSASRSMAFGHSPDLPDTPYGWHKVMDATRKRFGKDKPPEWFERKRKENPDLVWRNYYQWVLSPDPRDRASAEEVGQLAQEWCETAWPPTDGWQWIWSVHDDNANGIMHAHIILNAVNASTGLKVQISPEMSDSLAHTAQMIAESHGMGVLPDLKERRKAIRDGRRGVTEQSVRMSAAERSLRRRGGRSWVAEIRDEIDKAVDSSSSWDEFVDRLYDDGFSVEWSRRGIGYRHPESKGHDKKVLASSLGSNYSEEGIRSRIGIPVDVVLGAPAARTERRRRSSLTKLGANGLDVGRGFESSLRARLASGARLRGTDSVVKGMRALSLISSRGFRSSDEVESAFRTQMEELDSLESEVHEIESSISIAEEVLTRSRRIGVTRARVSALESKTMNPATRRERNELLAAIDGDIEFCRDALAQERSSVENESEFTEVASSILNVLRDRLGEVSISLDRARTEAEILDGAIASLRSFMGPRSIRDLGSIPSLGIFIERSRGMKRIPGRLPAMETLAHMALAESRASTRALAEANKEMARFEATERTAATRHAPYARDESTVDMKKGVQP